MDRRGTDDRLLRCSDADRERAAETLRTAAGDGRLTLTELEERLEEAFAARTYGELDPLLDDLGGPVAPPAGAAPRRRAAGAGAYGSSGAGGSAPVERVHAVLSGETRAGRWEVPRELEVLAWMGSCTLDLTQAVVRHRAVHVDANLYLSSFTMLVPEGIDVRLHPGGTVLGERRVRTPGRVTAGAPVLHLTGRVVLSSLTVRTPSRVANALRTLFG